MKCPRCGSADNKVVDADLALQALCLQVHGALPQAAQPVVILNISVHDISITDILYPNYPFVKQQFTEARCILFRCWHGGMKH